MEKSYVAKNQYGYDTLGIIVNDENKTVRWYGACTMPIGKHKKTSKKQINEMIDMYKSCGYRLIVRI